MKLILHIGLEKTGSTSIQAALRADRAVLASRGILYPRLFGSNNHMEIAVAATEPKANSELHLLELSREGCTHEEYRSRLKAALQKECSSGRYDTILISNEHCHSRLTTIESISYLSNILDVPFEESEVYVYLRRQDRLAVSLYSTKLKLGGQGDVFPNFSSKKLPYYFDFNRILENYSTVFGGESIRVRLYERAKLIDGDVVKDFYETANLGIKQSVSPRENESLSFVQSLFLAKFNERFPLIVNGAINKRRGPIFDVIKDTCKEGVFMPPRSEAEGFYSAFEESNRRVKNNFLPNIDRDTLFDEDFSVYPEEALARSLTEEELFAFIEAIWRSRKN